MAAALGQQRSPGNSRLGVDHMLPPGLGAKEHARRSSSLRSPFAAVLALDDDLEYAVLALYVFGDRVADYCERQHRRLLAASRAMDPLRPWLSAPKGAHD